MPVRNRLTWNCRNPSADELDSPGKSTRWATAYPQDTERKRLRRLRGVDVRPQLARGLFQPQILRKALAEPEVVRFPLFRFFR